MSAYFIFHVKVRDPEKYELYRQAISKEHLPSRYGGRYAALVGPTEVIEGDYDPGRVVIIEFPSKQKAIEWYESAEYQAAKQLRLASADATVLLVEGGQEWPPIRRT